MEGAKVQEFLTAQDACYAQVQKELAAGRKQTHWIWFIFPQLAELGFSATAKRFGLHSLDDARQFLAHPVLGVRFHECVRLVLAVEDREIAMILGSPDDLKFRSCLTLFMVAAPDEPVFGAALDKYYRGESDPLTLKLLGR